MPQTYSRWDLRMHVQAETLRMRIVTLQSQIDHLKDSAEKDAVLRKIQYLRSRQFAITIGAPDFQLLSERQET